MLGNASALFKKKKKKRSRGVIYDGYFRDSVCARACVCVCACPWDVGQLPPVPSAFCVINEQSSALGEVPHFLRDTLKGVTGEATSCWLSVTSGSPCQ